MVPISEHKLLSTTLLHAVIGKHLTNCVSGQVITLIIIFTRTEWSLKKWAKSKCEYTSFAHLNECVSVTKNNFHIIFYCVSVLFLNCFSVHYSCLYMSFLYSNTLMIGILGRYSFQSDVTTMMNPEKAAEKKYSVVDGNGCCHLILTDQEDFIFFYFLRNINLSSERCFLIRQPFLPSLSCFFAHDQTICHDDAFNQPFLYFSQLSWD